MEEGGKPPLIALIALILFSAYLSFAETAFSKVSKNKLKTAADKGDSRAEKALWIVNRLDRAITTILICNNLSNLSIASIVTVYVTKKWGVNFVSISTIITTIMVFLAGEMIPKTLAGRYSYKSSLSSSGLMKILMHIFKPIAAFLSFIGKKAADHTKEDSDGAVTEDEIQDIIEDMTEEGSIDAEQGNLITSAMQFGDIRVSDILTHRMNVTALDINKSPKEILNFIKKQTHSRIPVYQGSIDNIVGILGIRKFLKAYMHNPKGIKPEKLMDTAYFVHGDTEIHEILPLMSKHKINMAIVKDNNGGTAGIITVEDILEELVGDIYDESDVIEVKTTQKKEKENLYLDSEIVQSSLTEEDNEDSHPTQTISEGVQNPHSGKTESESSPQGSHSMQNNTPEGAQNPHPAKAESAKRTQVSRSEKTLTEDNKQGSNAAKPQGKENSTGTHIKDRQSEKSGETAFQAKVNGKEKIRTQTVHATKSAQLPIIEKNKEENKK